VRAASSGLRNATLGGTLLKNAIARSSASSPVPGAGGLYRGQLAQKAGLMKVRPRAAWSRKQVPQRALWAFEMSQGVFHDPAAASVPASYMIAMTSAGQGTCQPTPRIPD
jgi:hypothetical protein